MTMAAHSKSRPAGVRLDSERSAAARMFMPLDIQKPPSCDLLLDGFEVYLDDFLRRVKSHQDEAEAQIRREAIRQIGSRRC
jgi:hypothetical protein